MILVIPMAGEGRRFKEAGYDDPKPLIDVAGTPMIQRVLRNLPNVGRVVLGCRSESMERLKGLIGAMPMNVWERYKGDVTYCPFDEVTGGAALTVKKMIQGLPSGEEVVVANSDQWVDWVPWHFIEFARRYNADGCIATFTANDMKWSYVALDDKGHVTAVAEKNVISSHATCGIYYFRTAAILGNAITGMIENQSQVNGEWYLAPCYNELIADGKKILNYPVARMVGLGTPADLNKALVEGIFLQ